MSVFCGHFSGKRYAHFGSTTKLHVGVMSGLPPKADICGANLDVRYGPKADIMGKLVTAT
jgi:hypothetical protein